ncbi:hypothetical protein ALQ60_200074 [Pseudomonas syringae pv. papulans]|nr:hypothetical protein ALQ60_200074 [Pseudomonas syringae pv. papulans]
MSAGTVQFLGVMGIELVPRCQLIADQARRLSLGVQICSGVDQLSAGNDELVALVLESEPGQQTDHQQKQGKTQRADGHCRHSLISASRRLCRPRTKVLRPSAPVT